MEIPPADRVIERLLTDRLEAKRPPRPSTLESEVTQLFDDLRKPLHRYLSSFGLSIQDVEETVQEVFLSLFLHLRDGKPRSNIRGWIFRVAHNLGLKCREKNQRTLKFVVTPEQSLMELQLDAAPNPEEQFSSAQKRKRLLAVVNALSEQDKRCLYLRAEGLRYREIAEVLGMSLGGVASSLARSLERLARADTGD